MLVSEGRPLVEVDTLVLPGSDHSERSLGTVINAIDELAVARDFTHRAARVPQEDMAKPKQTNKQTNKKLISEP